MKTEDCKRQEQQNCTNLHPIADEDVVDKTMDEDFCGYGGVKVGLLQQFSAVGKERTVVGWVNSGKKHEVREVISSSYAVESGGQSR